MDMDAKTLLELGAVAANMLVLFTTLKVRADISDLKVWVLENFERRKNALAEVG